jgi:hypothetical protein
LGLSDGHSGRCWDWRDHFGAAVAFQFDKKLTDVKDAQNKEIERLKEQLSHLGDRGKRSNEMEFSAIRSVWEAFVEAWLSTNSAVIASIEVPDFAALSDEDIESIVTSDGLSSQEKKRLLDSNDKHKIYVRIMTWKLIARAGSEINTARLLLRKQRIFMPKEIREKFDAGIDSMTKAFVGKKLQFQDPQNFKGKSSIAYLENHMQLFEGVADAANERLFRDERKRFLT